MTPKRKKPKALIDPFDEPLAFDPEHAGAREVFCAALIGIMSTSEWRCSLSAKDTGLAARIAVEFSHQIVREMHRRMAIPGMPK